jgi:tetratricopeptide (TPR) repeat protein
MRKSAAVFFLIVARLLAVIAARAGEPAAANRAQPWEKDQALLATVQQEIKSGGIMSVQAHVAEMERALAGAKLSFIVDEPAGKTIYTLTDGAAEALVATSMASIGGDDAKATQAVAIQNPYPALGFNLGCYYDEVGRPADALRVLDIALSLDPVSGLDLGAQRAILIAERGAPLEGLHRWPDVLANFDTGLKIDDLDNLTKALMERGRGFALTELGRLDDAAAAYNDSLKNEPGNAHAQSELKYIARLRASGSTAATGLMHVLPPPSNDSGGRGASTH